VVQDTLVPDLVPGQEYPWSMKIGGTVALPGELVAPPPVGTPIRVAFVANTTQPDGALVWAAIAEADPDVVLHGGDLQARSEPDDTWSAAFHAMAPITARALLHATPGDRDHEDDELAQQWLRRFGGQGRPGSGDTYHAFDIGGVRFIGLEAAGLETSTSPQVRWLEDELGDIAASDALQFAILFLHHDLYTLADAEPDLDARATLADIVAGFDVPLVLSGNSLAYERFTVGDTTWIVDGGGGTGVSDVNEKVDARPADAALRVAADASLGFTLVDVDASGTITVSRQRLDGSEADRVELPAARR
jgi:hypothetical protein